MRFASIYSAAGNGTLGLRWCDGRSNGTEIINIKKWKPISLRITEPSGKIKTTYFTNKNSLAWVDVFHEALKKGSSPAGAAAQPPPIPQTKRHKLIRKYVAKYHSMQNAALIFSNSKVDNLLQKVYYSKRTDGTKEIPE